MVTAAGTAHGPTGLEETGTGTPPMAGGTPPQEGRITEATGSQRLRVTPVTVLTALMVLVMVRTAGKE